MINIGNSISMLLEDKIRYNLRLGLIPVSNPVFSVIGSTVWVSVSEQVLPVKK